MRLDIDLTDTERQRLQLAVGGANDIERIARIVARAGAREAIDYATGVAVFSSMADLRSYRIACLLSEGMTISEAEALVGALFKVPLSTARRLVNAAVARYAVELGEDVRKAAAEALDAAQWDGDSERWLVALPTTFIRQRVMDLLSREALPDLQTAERGALWKVPAETYDWLRSQHGLQERPEPGR